MSLHLAQNMLLLALILTMLAGIVLGMGMPTTPAYIIMTALLVPAIIKFGVLAAGRAHVRVLFRHPLGDHAAGGAGGVAAAGLAKSDLWATGWAAVRIARDRLHRAVHVRLRAGAADDRRLADDHLVQPDGLAAASCCSPPDSMATFCAIPRCGSPCCLS